MPSRRPRKWRSVDWEALRDDFPILSRTTYLNSCSKGAVSRDAIDAHARFVEQWASRGAASWYDHWMDDIDAWRTNVARLLGCRKEEVAWGPSVGQLVGSIASALARNHADDGRNDVVAFEQEFPSVAAGWSTRPGVTMRYLPSPDGIRVPESAYAEAIGESTRAVVTSRVHYNSGGIQDVAAIGAAAREAGAFSLVEDYHGTGQLPADVHAWGVDAAVGGALKWLCGGVASCFLYVRQDIIKGLEPQHSGWWGNEGMFDFDNTTFRYWDDARRFEVGEVNLHGISMSNAAMEKLLGIGMDRIRARNVELVADLLERLEDAGQRVRVQDGAESHSALVMVERDDPKADVARLEQKHNVIVDDRPGCVRVSPHFYNTIEENEKFVQGLSG